MDCKTIQELIKAVSESPLTTFEYEQNGTKLVMKKENTIVSGNNAVVYSQPVVETVAPVSVPVAEPVKEVVAETKTEVVDGQKVIAPMVGTFYASSAPDKPAYVKVGDKVKKGQVLCIIEAMKLMNEIESTVDGEVVEILVNNEDMVEYGQELFVIK